ncbi:hypothetical protein GQX74_011363, partial [Glossina fuscipes]
CRDNTLSAKAKKFYPLENLFSFQESTLNYGDPSGQINCHKKPQYEICNNNMLFTNGSSFSSIPPSLERQRQNTLGNTAVRSSLTGLGIDFCYNKSTQSFSPSRLFHDDLANLVDTSLIHRIHHPPRRRHR